MFTSLQTSDVSRGIVCLLALTMGLMACAGTHTTDEKNHLTPEPIETNEDQSVSTPVVDSPPKTPQGYIRSDVYQPERYGGFIGDCAREENFSHYWECMSENAGNGFE